jgi:hypothetical protein
MKRILAAIVIVAVGVFAAVVPAAAATPSLAPHGLPLHVVNLHAAFERALSHEKAGQVSGVVPPAGSQVARPRSGATASPCTEPECDLSFQGGPVQHSPHVYLLLWGPNWSNSDGDYADLYYLYDGLGVSPDDTWSDVTSQYADGTGSPVFTGSVFEGAWQDSSTPPDPLTPDDLAVEAASLISTAGITDLADAQVVVASQSGTCYSDGFAGSCGIANSEGSYCGWHSYATNGNAADNLPFVNMPYMTDAGDYCGENFISSGAAGTYDGLSMIAGHEYAETITDPIFPTGWTDPSDTISDGGEPGEVADKCAWGGSNWGKLGSDPYGYVTLSTGTFAMQSLWSNAAGGCVMTTSPSLTVTTPATQHSILGTGVSFRVRAVTNTGLLHYAAAGLPPGLSMNHSGTITGIPAVTAGTFPVHVTVSEYAGSQTVAFRWQVSSKAGAVKGYKGLCADDYDGRKGDGNKIDVWSCDGQARQKITFTASGELYVAGKCITSHRGLAALEPCAGSAAQTWAHNRHGEYSVQGRCLTDPRNSTKNGKPLTLAACTDNVGQRWSLP